MSEPDKVTKPQRTGRRNRGRDDKKTQTSRALTKILRHSAKKENIDISEEGFVLLDDLFKKQKFKGVTVDDVKDIVATCAKQRFHMEERMNPTTNTLSYYIRANQGHSMEIKELDLKPVTGISQLPNGPICIHGTFKPAWELIKDSGLSRMNRQHVHFACGEFGDREVISGMRKTCDIYIHMDVEKMLQDGVPLFISANNVLLSPGVGDTGIVPVKYFDKVVERSTGAVLFPV
jgi:RNA:NAD 2'-phosphotransferase (TPT1/KptA family)